MFVTIMYIIVCMLVRVCVHVYKTVGIYKTVYINICIDETVYAMHVRNCVKCICMFVTIFNPYLAAVLSYTSFFSLWIVLLLLNR